MAVTVLTNEAVKEFNSSKTADLDNISEDQKTTDYGDCVCRAFEGQEAIDRVDLRPVVPHSNGLYRLVQSNSEVFARATRGPIPRASIDLRPAADR